MYCPKCGSFLYPDDTKYMQAVGVCGNCVTYDKPDGAYRKKWLAVSAAKPIKYGRDHVVFRHGYNGREYITEHGASGVLGLAKMFTEKQAKAYAARCNTECATRTYFVAKVDGGMK